MFPSIRIHTGPTCVFFASIMFTGFLAGCGGGGSSGGGGAATPAPTAHAQADQTVAVGTLVTADGTTSESPSGAPLSYQWAMTQKPAGSIASLSNPASARASFTPDVAGVYTITLVVHANGVPSQPDAVSITAMTGNVPPVANAGPARSTPPGQPVTLDGTASHDPNNTSITYSWRIVQQPPGSHPILTNANTATPTLTADVPGVYTLQLTVSDGSLTSPPVQTQCTVATGNLPPIANAGPDQTVTAGQLVTLNGSGSSDPNGDPLTYSWCVQGKPEGSTVTLNGANMAQPTFTPDIAGSYVFCLTVDDGKGGTGSDRVLVEGRLPSSGSGALQAYLKPSNTTLFPQVAAFGQAVALDGDTLVVGTGDPSCAIGVNGDPTNSSCPGAGAVYVFTRTGSTWSQQAYLKASNTQTGDSFGTSVSLRGNTLAVGAPREGSCSPGINDNQADNGCPSAGAVYLFTRTGNTWSQQAYVKASNPNGGDFFGQSISLSGNTLAVGATAEDGCATGVNGNQTDNACIDAGAVYIFTRNENGWTQEAYVKASNTAPFDAFGNVVLDGDTLAVGAPVENGCATGINGDQSSSTCRAAGAVYVYTRTASVWTQQAYVKASTINPHPQGGADRFGAALALNADSLIVGAPGQNSCATGIDGNQSDIACEGAGAAYIFTRTNNVWSQVAFVKPIAASSSFGRGFAQALAFDGTTLAVGSGDATCATGFNPSPGLSGCDFSGAVYLFSRTASSWAQQAFVKATNPDAFDFFGAGLGIVGHTLAVGAPSEDSCATGINGNQSDNNCGPLPNAAQNLQNPAVIGSGAAYVYVLQ